MSKAAIIDNGSGTCRVGFADDEIPKDIFPSIIGRPRKDSFTMNMDDLNEYYLADEADLMRPHLSLSYPMDRGVIQDWNDMEKLWDYAFRQLQATPEGHPVLLTDMTLANPKDRERMTSIMFEKFGVSKLYICDREVLSLLGTGRHTGVVLHSGYGVTSSVPICDGIAMKNKSFCQNLAGCDLTYFLMKLLGEKGLPFCEALEFEIVRDMKETLCFVASDYNQEGDKCPKEMYRLPDGRMINIGKERITVGEALFQPSLLEMEANYKGIQELVFASVEGCSLGERMELYGNIVLSGGTTMMPGFGARMKSEISALAPDSNNPKIIAPPGRKHSAWIGGSIMASLSSFDSMWKSKNEYNESGQ